MSSYGLLEPQFQGRLDDPFTRGGHPLGPGRHGVGLPASQFHLTITTTNVECQSSEICGRRRKPRAVVTGYSSRA